MPHIYVIGASWATKRSFVTRCFKRDILADYSMVVDMYDRSLPKYNIPIHVISSPTLKESHVIGTLDVRVDVNGEVCEVTTLPSFSGQQYIPADAVVVLCVSSDELRSANIARDISGYLSGISATLHICVIDTVTKPFTVWDFGPQLRDFDGVFAIHTLSRDTNEIPAVLQEAPKAKRSDHVCISPDVMLLWKLICYFAGDNIVSPKYIGRIPIKLGRADQPHVRVWTDDTTSRDLPIMTSIYETIEGVKEDEPIIYIEINDNFPDLWFKTCASCESIGEFETVIWIGGRGDHPPDLPGLMIIRAQNEPCRRADFIFPDFDIPIDRVGFREYTAFNDFETWVKRTLQIE